MVREAKRFDVAAPHPTLNIAEWDNVGFGCPLRVFWRIPEPIDDFL